MTAGKFISLEGGEGAGKTTQAERLRDTLENLGIKTLLTREPGGTKGAEAIRELVLSGSHEKWSSLTELLLIYAARHDHVEKLIKPALERGIWVISDRFADSSLAYQGYARGLGADKVKQLHALILGDFQPDLTILFDIDPVLSKSRVEKRGGELSRFDKESLPFHNILRDAFLDIAVENQDRFFTVDAGRDRDFIQSRILEALKSRYPDGLKDV